MFYVDFRYNTRSDAQMIRDMPGQIQAGISAVPASYMKLLMYRWVKRMNKNLRKNYKANFLPYSKSLERALHKAPRGARVKNPAKAWKVGAGKSSKFAPRPVQSKTTQVPGPIRISPAGEDEHGNTSAMYARVDFGVRVNPYAFKLDRGGVIKPKTAKYLTFPYGDRPPTWKKRPMSFKNRKPFFLPREDADVKIMFVPMGKRGRASRIGHARYAHSSDQSFGKLKKGQKRTGAMSAIPMFILMKQVTLQPTRWIRDAMDESVSDIPAMIQKISTQVKPKA